MLSPYTRQNLNSCGSGCTNLNRMCCVGQQDAWRYDFNKVSLAATVIYIYIFAVPVALWAYLKFVSKEHPSLLDIITVYGYSVFVFIPMAVRNQPDQPPSRQSQIPALAPWRRVSAALYRGAMIISSNLSAGDARSSDVCTRPFSLA